MKKLELLVVVALVVFSVPSWGRVYKDVEIPEPSVERELAPGAPFLNWLQENIFPTLRQGKDVYPASKDYFEALLNGNSVAIKFTEDVSLFNVGFRNEFRFGRSFAAVGKEGNTYKTVADVSYHYYLKALQLHLKDAEESELFFSALFSVLLYSDASGLNDLSDMGKELVAFALATYVAEQHRLYVGDLLEKTHDKGLPFAGAYDLLVVTMLGAYHSGQEKLTLFYEGRFTNKVYAQLIQGEVLHRNLDSPFRTKDNLRPAKLFDYWQFKKEGEELYSGVALTRTEATKLCRYITAAAAGDVALAQQKLSYLLSEQTRGPIRTIARRLSIAPPNQFDRLVVPTLVKYLSQTRKNAKNYTNTLLRH